jgi:hypothetical protein
VIVLAGVVAPWRSACWRSSVNSHAAVDPADSRRWIGCRRRRHHVAGRPDDTTDVAQLGVVGAIDDSPLWWVLYVVILLIGVFTQFQALDGVRGTLREQWDSDGGKYLRPS